MLTLLKRSKLNLFEHFASNTSVVIAHHDFGGTVKALTQTITDSLKVGQSHPTSLDRATINDKENEQLD